MDLSRRQLLFVGAAAGGGFLVGWPRPSGPRILAAAANAAPAVFAPNAFIRIGRDGRITLIMNQVEMGQGTYTSMPMLLAEELEVGLGQVHLEHAPPDDRLYSVPVFGFQVTGASCSVRLLYEPLRRAGAAARSMLVAAAAQTWSVDAASCRAEKGVVTPTPTGRTLRYGALADKAATLPVPAQVVVKDPRDFKLIGTPAKRLDTPGKVNGTAQFGIDIRLPGMKIATVAASPVVGGKLAFVDDSKAKAIRGVRQIVRLDDAVAVVADNMWAAKQGLKALTLRWEDGPNGTIATADVVRGLAAAAETPGVMVRNEGDAPGVIAAASRKVESVYEAPFLAHAALEPVNCTVHVRPDRCEVWTGSQVLARVQAAAAKVTGLPPPAVRNGIDPDAVDGAAQLLYDIPAIRVEYVRHEELALNTGFWRGVGVTHNTFVIESFIDELAAAAKQDPVAYRRALLGKSARAKAVLDVAAREAGWGRPLPEGRGRGVSVLYSEWGSYLAAIAEASVSKAGEVRVHRVVCAVDCGTVVNPDTVKAQIEGGIIFGIGGALWGEVTLEKGRIQQSNFHDVRVLRINEAPAIAVHLVRNLEAPGGIGEPGTAVTAPAAAKAGFAAAGERNRQPPLEKQPRPALGGTPRVVAPLVVVP